MPYRAAKTPPRSTSPTTTTGASAWRATARLVMSWRARLISAGEPAPSATTTSQVARRRSRAAVTSGQKPRLAAWYSAAPRCPKGRPLRTTWAVASAVGLSRTGFMSAVGSTPAAIACMACARPISAPSLVT